MKVRTCRTSGIASQTNRVTGTHQLIFLDQLLGQMTINSFQTVIMTNNNITSITTATLIFHHTHLAIKGCANRVTDIDLHIVEGFIKDEATFELLDSAHFDYAVDAIDTLSPKAHLIKGSLDRSIPIVSCMGTGGKTDPTKLEIADISRTHHCPLAHMLRKRLHKMGIHKGFYAVFSAEKVREGSMIIDEQLNKKSNTGTISYMPAVFGCCCASVVVRDLIGEVQ